MSDRAIRVTRPEAVPVASRGAPARLGDQFLTTQLTQTALPERARQRRRLRALAEGPAFQQTVGIPHTAALQEVSKPAWRR